MPTTGQILLLSLSIALFVIGGIISFARIWREWSWSRLASRCCMLGGVMTALAVLLWHAMARGRWIPLENNFDSLIWLAISLAIFVIYMQRRRPIAGLDWFVMPIAVLLLILAAVTGRTNPHEYHVGGDVWSWVHRATAYGGSVAFAIAAASGAMYLIVNYRLRSKKALDGPPLGNLERLEHLSLTSVTLGFALLTIGAVTGFIQILYEDQRTSAAKVVLSSAVWLVYALVLHAPFIPNFRGRRAAMLSIVGFALMIGTIVAVLLLPATS